MIAIVNSETLGGECKKEVSSVEEGLLFALSSVLGEEISRDLSNDVLRLGAGKEVLIALGTDDAIEIFPGEKFGEFEVALHRAEESFYVDVKIYGTGDENQPVRN